MAVASLAVMVDEEEYSRYEADRDTITATIFPQPTTGLSEDITVELVKGRRNRDSVVYTTTVTLSGNVSAAPVSIDLKEITDSQGIHLIRRGTYFVRASNAAGDVVGESPDFRITVITSHRLQRDYSFGLDLRANDVPFPLFQPQVITGITITELSKNHPEEFLPLTLDVTDGVKALSWNGGTLVPVRTAGKLVLRSKDGSSYMVVKTAGPQTLPASTTVEEIGITKDVMSDTTLRRYIDQALDYTENVALQTYIEPTQVISGPDLDLTNFGFGNPRGITNNEDYDFIRNAVTWYPTPPGHWIQIKFPMLWVLQVNNLFGRLADTRIIDIQNEWVELDVRSGFCELVPFNRQLGFTYEGLTWATALIGQGSLPNFWRYNVISGLRDTPFDVQEFAAKKAAIDVLTIAGQAFRGGFSSQSISRDGVSESVSYTSSAVYGIYSSTIEELKRFVRDELPKLRGKYTGTKLTVL